MLLEGHIIDAHTGCPVQGAEVCCLGPGGLFQRLSDGKGYFKFIILRTGDWQVEVTKPPYAAMLRSYVLADSLNVSLSLELDVMAEEAVTA